MVLPTDTMKKMERIAERLEEWLKPEPDNQVLIRHKYTHQAGFAFSLQEPLEGFGKILDELKLNEQNGPYELLKEKYNGLWRLAQKADQQKQKHDERRKLNLQQRGAQDIDEFLAIKNLEYEVRDLVETLRNVVKTAQNAEKPAETEQKAIPAKRWRIPTMIKKVVEKSWQIFIKSF